MAQFDVFVARREELALVEEWAERWDTMHMIAVEGGGGIGKTFLLQKIAQTYRARPEYVVVYYDFAEQPPGNLREASHIAETLGWENFPRFHAKVTDLASGRYDVADTRLPELERETFETGLNELDQFLANKRLIRITDTLDAGLPQRPQAQEWYQYASHISNALFITAGRNVPAFLDEFRKGLGADNVTHVVLRGFDQDETDEFFAQMDPDDQIPADMRAKLRLLTDGRPVLLSLATDWLARELPLPEIIDRSLDDLQALPEPEATKLREQFEFELVDRVRQLKGALDRAILYMAHISRRNDVEILSVLLDVTREEAHRILEQLAELSFVKYNPVTGSCMLHDEMKNLVNKHAWPYVDPTGDVRKRLTQKIIGQYYQPRLNELVGQIKAQLESDHGPIQRTTISDQEWEQWHLEAECLYYHLKVDEEEGLAYFEDRFREAQRNNHIMRIQFLLSEVEQAGHGDIRALQPRRAEAMLMRGELEQARTICQNILATEGMSPDNLIAAHVTLGRIISATQPAAAQVHYEAALALAQQKNDNRLIGILHNNLGQLYRMTGQLARAVHHYQQAIQFSKLAGSQPLIASATNNLGYIYRLQGNLSEANVLCRVALATRKKLGLERDLAYSYLTKAEIDRDKGDLESAEHYTKLALRSFDKLSEVRGQIMAYRSLANIHRHLEQYDEAEAYLDTGISLAEQIHDEPLLASLLNVYGREQRSRGLSPHESTSPVRKDPSVCFAQAEEYLERSLKLAEQYGDLWLLTRGQLELALTYFISGSHLEGEVIQMLNQAWENTLRLNDRLLQGYIEEIRGQMAMRHADYVTAARHFGLGAELIAKRQGREQERFFDRLSDWLLDSGLSPEATRTLAFGILDVIQESSADESLASLNMLCHQVLESEMV